jgi:hypothetical protein
MLENPNRKTTKTQKPGQMATSVLVETNTHVTGRSFFSKLKSSHILTFPLTQALRSKWSYVLKKLETRPTAASQTV